MINYSKGYSPVLAKRKAAYTPNNVVYADWKPKSTHKSRKKFPVFFETSQPQDSQ